MNTVLIPFDFKDVHLTESCWIDGMPHFTRRAIGEYLGYAQPNPSMANVIKRNPHIKEFSETIVLPAPNGKKYLTEVYSLIGVQLIANQSNQPRSVEFQIAIAHMEEALRIGQLQPPQGPVSEAQRFARLEGRLAKLESLTSPVPAACGEGESPEPQSAPPCQEGSCNPWRCIGGKIAAFFRRKKACMPTGQRERPRTFEFLIAIAWLAHR